MAQPCPAVADRAFDHPHPGPLPQAGEGAEAAFSLSRLRERAGVRVVERRL